jgi:hypothetical protein
MWNCNRTGYKALISLMFWLSKPHISLDVT